MLVPNEVLGTLACPYCGGLYRLDGNQEERHQESRSKTAPDVAAIIEQAKNANSESQFRSLLWILASIRGDAAMVYLTEVSTSTDALRAPIAVEALKQAYSQESSIPALVAGLKNPHPLVRVEVAGLVTGRYKWLAGDAEVADALVASLADPIYDVRMLCAIDLGDSGTKDAVPALVQAWKVAARDGYFPAAGYVDGGAPQFLVMKSVEDSLKKLVPAEADRLIREVEQDRSLSELARSWIDYRRSPSSRNYRKMARRVR
ncbi:MAG TPA: HEAT repeat domain-containing protein [Bryobacteraceae bacterium]|nr:HEAT repeat domain-containing protein [Bryobacteraceae bacterium]